MTNASKWMALSYASCKFCFGRGVREYGIAHVETVCDCCNRGVCRSVVSAYNFYSESIGQTLRGPQLSSGSHRQGRRTTGNRQAEWCADVWLCARRNLSTRQFSIFRRHLIAGEQWNQFGIEWGVFWHDKYRLEGKLGRIFRELQPYALYPIDEYFADSSQTLRADARALYPAGPSHPNGKPLVPPMQPAPQAVKVAPSVPPKAVLVMPAPAVPEVQPSTEWRIRHWLKDGLSFASITARLDKAGIPAPDGADRWATSAVKRILLTERAA